VQSTFSIRKILFRQEYCSVKGEKGSRTFTGEFSDTTKKLQNKEEAGKSRKGVREGQEEEVGLREGKGRKSKWLHVLAQQSGGSALARHWGGGREQAAPPVRKAGGPAESPWREENLDPLAPNMRERKSGANGMKRY